MTRAKAIPREGMAYERTRHTVTRLALALALAHPGLHNHPVEDHMTRQTEDRILAWFILAVSAMILAMPFVGALLDR